MLEDYEEVVRENRERGRDEVEPGSEPGYEWEGYDGWFNNPAHPDWGGAGRRFAADSCDYRMSGLHALFFSRYAPGKEDASSLSRRRVRDCWTRPAQCSADF